MIMLLVSITWTFVSQNNEYCLYAEMVGGMTFEADKFMLKKGNSIQYHVYNPGVHTFFVSDHGTVFGVGDHHAMFYDRTGKCDTLMPVVYLNKCGFSERHDLFYLSVRDGIYVYTLDGALLHSLAPGRLLASTDGGEHIAVVSTDTLTLYAEGTSVHTIVLETAYVRSVSYTEDGTVRIEERSGIEVLDMITGRKVE